MSARRWFVRHAGLVATVALLAACGRGRTDTLRAPANPQQAEEVMRVESSADRLVDRGRGFASVGDLLRAAQYYSAALREGASEEEVLPLLLDVYVKSGQYLLAAATAEDALAHSPSDTRLRFLAASLYLAVGDTDRAEEHLRRIIHLEPQHSQAHYTYAVLLRDVREDWIRADHHFRQYLLIEPEGSHAEEARASLLEVVP